MLAMKKEEDSCVNVVEEDSCINVEEMITMKMKKIAV